MPYVNNQGIHIYYEVKGKGSPLVLQHGRAMSLEQWHIEGYVKALETDYQLVLIDARGHGRSDKPHAPQAYRKALWASDVVAVLDDLGVDKAHFMGYSMGGRVGFRIAKYTPERFSSLIIGGMDPYEPELDGPNPREHRIQFLRQGKDAVLAAMEETAGPGWTPEVKAIHQANDLEALIAQLTFRERVGLVDMLPSLEVPCLLYVGEEDGHYSEAKRASEMIRDATFVSFPGLNHLEVLSRPDLVLPHIRTFLTGIDES